MSQIRTNLLRRRGISAPLGLLAVWLATGVYVVGPDQQAVVRLFGEALEPVEPGVWWRPPYPLSIVDRIRTRETRQVSIGVTAASAPDGQAETSGEEMVTGDRNLVQVQAEIQYSVRDARAYLFSAENPDDCVTAVAHALLTEAFAAEPVDYLMTTGRDAVRQRVHDAAQLALDSYAAGVAIRNVSLAQVAPPQPVAAAFNDVHSAEQDRDRLVNEATGYANELVPTARGQAAESLSAAEIYRTRQINDATGQASRFQKLAAAYRTAPQVTRIRLHLETVERIAPNVKLTIVDGENGSRPIDLGILGLGARPAAPTE